MMDRMQFSDGVRAQLRGQFVLLGDENAAKGHSALPLRVSGYEDVMYLIADIVKVSILALDGNGHGTSANIPEPATNISGLLAVVLDLIPYEEARLLDLMRQEVLCPPPPEAPDWDFILATVTLGAPAEMPGS